MINLKKVSLVAITSVQHLPTIEALRYSAKDINFGEVLFFSEKDPCPNETFFRHIKTKKFTNVSEWGEFVIFELHKFINTPYIILIHADGFIVNPSKWTNKFLKYDYIGSPWAESLHPIAFKDANGNNCRVGNSVSLRSKKILELPTKLNLRWGDFILNLPHEDGFLCAQHKVLLESKGIKFAPLEIAVHFGREYQLPENIGISPFLFHKWQGENKYFPNFLNEKIHDKYLKFFKKFISKLCKL